MKDTLTEIKSNLQENNSTVGEAENQMNDLEHKEAKNKQSKRQEEKRIQKNKDSVRSLWDNFKCKPVFASWVCWKKKTKIKELKKSL